MQQQEYKRPRNPLGALVYDLHVAVSLAAEPPPVQAAPIKAPTGRPLGDLQRARKVVVLAAVAALESQGEPPTATEVYNHVRTKSCGWGGSPGKSLRNVLDCAAIAGDLVRYSIPPAAKRAGSAGTRRQVRFGIPK